MQIEVNKGNRITCVVFVGGVENGIEVEDFQFEHRHFDYKYENGTIKYDPVKNKNDEFVNKIYDENLDLYIEGATKDEQLEYLKQEILKNTRELLVYKESGFSNDELQAKIDILVEKHRAISEEIAREENKLY